MTEVDWQAQWIWGAVPAGADASENGVQNGGSGQSGNAVPNAEEGNLAERYFYFRQTFTLGDCEIATGVLHVCADTRYRLWLNGQMLGHGPARSDPAFQYFDTYAIADRLKPGVNVLAALVTHYGIGTCYSRVGSPGFLLQADISLINGDVIALGTDATWKVCPAPYESGFPRLSIQLAYPEVFDARREPLNWNLAGFEDSDWAEAVVLGPVGIAPWTTLIPRDIPLPFFRAIAPQRIVQKNRALRGFGRTGETSAVPPAPTRLTPAEDMEHATCLEPAPARSVTSAHPALFTIAPQPRKEAMQASPEGVSVVLDFGREVSGFPLLVVRKSGGGTLDIGYSERIEADGSVNPNRWGGCDVHYADRLILRAGFQRFQTLDHRAFRYLRLDVYDNPEPIEILVEMVTSGYPVENRGDFQCSDARLQAIWEVGRATTALCMDDGFMDCPWRERGQWLGDARVEALVAAYAFGDTDLARKALLQYPQSQEDTGWFRGVFPSDPPFDAILPTFCMIWPVALWDYFMLTGDRTLLDAVWPSVERLVTAITRHTDEDGLIGGLPGWVFVDWANINVKGQSTAVNAQAYDALRHAAKIARTLGYPERGEQWQLQAADLADSLNDLMWDRERGLYREGIAEGVRLDTVSEQSNVLCALTGIADGRQRDSILAFTFQHASLLLAEKDGTQLEDTDRLQYDVSAATPYFSFYYLRLLYANGEHQRALAYLRQRWGAMLDAGATTFWEQWQPHWSLCHAWAAGPTHDLLAEFAGIRPLQPGFEEFTLALRPCGLTWLRARVPTPRGDIALAYHYRTDRPEVDPMGSKVPLGLVSPAITVTLEIPTGSRALVRLPLGGIAAPTVRFNGKTIWEKGTPISPSGAKFTREGDILAFAIIGGRYVIEIEREA